MKSLQDQLLKAGLVDEKTAKKIRKESKKKGRKLAKGEQAVDEVKLAAQQQMEQKAQRDREISRQNQAKLEQKMILEQIKQLIQSHRIERSGGEQGYQFADQKKIKKIYVREDQVRKLAKGLIAIVKSDQGYELLPKVIAEKIAQRAPERLILLNEKVVEQHDEDDPYADYPIPDDLMW